MYSDSTVRINRAEEFKTLRNLSTIFNLKTWVDGDQSYYLKINNVQLKSTSFHSL